MAFRRQPQLAFDEQTIHDAACENALEFERQAVSAARSRYDEANEKAKVEIAKLELPVGGAARVGRFRITRQHVPARSVSFDSKATDRIRISLAGED